MITYAEFSASFGSGEAHGGCGGGKIETEATIFVPVREHLISRRDLLTREGAEAGKEPGGRKREAETCSASAFGRNHKRTRPPPLSSDITVVTWRSRGLPPALGLGSPLSARVSLTRSLC